jgi:hypothetical protein
MLCYNMAHPVTINYFTQTTSSFAKYTSQKKVPKSLVKNIIIKSADRHTQFAGKVWNVVQC